MSKDFLEELGELATFDEVAEWAARVWKDAKRTNMRTPQNLEEQLILSATECIPQRTGDPWRASVFIRFPAGETSYGGFRRIRVAKAVFSWPERELIYVFEE